MAANRLIYLTVWMAMLAGFIGYLLYAPHSEGIPQINRVRAITASMKLAHLIVGFSDLVNVDQWCAFLGNGGRILWGIQSCSRCTTSGQFDYITEKQKDRRCQSSCTLTISSLNDIVSFHFSRSRIQRLKMYPFESLDQ